MAGHRAVVWGAVAVAAAVVGLTGYVIVAGDDPETADSTGRGRPSASASPDAEYTAPEEWDEPERWAALPRGERDDERGREVGFPHSTQGAVALLVAATTTTVEGDHTTVDEHLELMRSYYPEEDQTSYDELRATQAARMLDDKLRRQMGLSIKQEELPPGAYARNIPIGYKIIEESEDVVTAWLLARFTVSAGETQPEKSSYTRTLLAARWDEDARDWKVAIEATQDALKARPAKPRIAAPGDPTFNAAGWTAIRQAS